MNGSSLTLDATSAESVAHGIVALNNSTVTVNSDTINISANGVTMARAIEASGKTGIGTVTLGTQKFCNRATKAFVALAHQMPSSFRNSWSRFTDSVLQRLIPRGVITEVVFTQSNHSRT